MTGSRFPSPRTKVKDAPERRRRRRSPRPSRGAAALPATTAWATPSRRRRRRARPDRRPARPRRRRDDADGTDTGRPRSRHLRADHRRRHDPLRGAAPGRHRDRARPAGPGCASTSRPSSETVTVPVRKEAPPRDASRSPTPTAARPLDGPDISEEEHEVILHEERPVVDRDRRAGRAGPPRHRDRSPSRRPSPSEVRKEQIEADGDVDRRLSPDRWGQPSSLTSVSGRGCWRA